MSIRPASATAQRTACLFDHAYFEPMLKAAYATARRELGVRTRMFGPFLFSAVHDAAASTLERMIDLFEDDARRPDLPNEKAAVSWACTVTRFVLCERARDERKYLPYGDLSQAGPEANPEPREDSPAERLRRTLDRIGDGLDARELCQQASLTEGQRIAICRRLNGATLEQIGLELGSSPTSARQRSWALIERAVARLERTAKQMRG